MNKQIKLWQSILSTVLVAAVILTGVFVYVGKLRSGVEQLYDGAQQLADGSNQIKDGLSQVSDGTGSLNDGLEQYTDGVAQVDDGLGTLQDGLGTYTDGVAQVDKGLGTLQGGLKTYTGGVTSIKSGTDTALKEAAVPTFAEFIGTKDPATLSSVANQITAEAQANSYATASSYARSFVIKSVFGGSEAEFNRIMTNDAYASDDATTAAVTAALNNGTFYAIKPFADSKESDATYAYRDFTIQQLLALYAKSYATVGMGIGNAATEAGAAAQTLQLLNETTTGIDAALANLPAGTLETYAQMDVANATSQDQGAAIGLAKVLYGVTSNIKTKANDANTQYGTKAYKQQYRKRYYEAC